MHTCDGFGGTRISGWALIVRLLGVISALGGLACGDSIDSGDGELDPGSLDTHTDMSEDAEASTTTTAAPVPGEDLPNPVRVRTVKDGDTIEVLRGDTTYTVRFKGIDTPELGGNNGPEPYAEDARQAVWDAIGTQYVSLEFDAWCGDVPYVTCRDQYGRVLAYVRSELLADVGESLLARGLARVYRYRQEEFDRLSAYEAAQTAAQSQQIGLWAP